MVFIIWELTVYDIFLIESLGNHTEAEISFWWNFVTSYARRCHFDNFQHIQWQKFYQNDNILASVYTCPWSSTKITYLSGLTPCHCYHLSDPALSGSKILSHCTLDKITTDNSDRAVKATGSRPNNNHKSGCYLISAITHWGRVIHICVSTTHQHWFR